MNVEISETLERLLRKCDETSAGRDLRLAALNLLEDAELARDREKKQAVGRERAEAAGRATEEQFRRAIEEAPIPVIMHAEDGQVLQISKTWTELTGYTPEDIPTFEAWLNRAYGPGADAVREHVHALFRGGKRVLNVEIEVTARSGQRRCWAFSASAPGALQDGRRFVVGMALDVTERRATENALRESQERLRLIVENAREYAIFSMDLNRHVTSWNSGAQFILGYSQEEIMGRSGDIIFTEADRAAGAPEQEATTALAEGRAADERWHVRKDGSQLWGSGVMTIMSDSAGQAIGLLKIFRDQTEAKQSAEALQQNRAKLEAAFLEMQQAREEAEVANRTKDRFLAMLSHELRTPLTPVLGAAEMMLRQKDLSTRNREGLEMICRNVELQTHLINDLLDITRISRGTLELVRQSINLYDAVKSAVEISLPDIQTKHQQLSVQLHAEQQRVRADLHRTQQVFWNLLKNASKFTPEGGQIRITSRNEPGRVVVEISDSGMGIDPAALPNIFDAFQQADASVARRFGGLGLGLAIAKATVDAHGGAIAAASAGTNRGATFTVAFPLEGHE